VLAESEVCETVVSQEMVRHGNVNENDAAVAASDAVETDNKDEAADSGDGWLSGWKLSDVVSKTSSVVQQTVQQTSNVVRCRFFSLMTVSVRVRVSLS